MTGARTRPARPGWPLLCGLLAGLLQVNFLLELVLPGSLPVTTSLVSELSAPGQPYAWAYRGGDLASGLLTLELARLLARGWRDRAGLATALLVAAYGLGLVVSALVPTSCDDRLGRCGGHVLLTSAAPLGDRVHDLVSIIGGIGVLVACATGALVLRHAGQPRRAAVLLGTAVVAAALGASALAQVSLSLPTGQGVVQRVQVALSSLVVVLLGEALRAPRRPGPPRPRSPRAGGSPARRSGRPAS